MTLPLNL